MLMTQPTGSGSTGAPAPTPNLWSRARRPAAASATWFDRWCLSRLQAGFAGSPVRLRLWDGTSVVLGADASAGTIDIADRGTLAGLLFRTDLAFGEAYADGRLTVDGDLSGMLEAVYDAMAGRWAPSRGWRRTTGASPSDARHNVHAHYDIGNAFYRLWLDEAMVYTCAYFERPDMSLEDAQTAKLDYVCRKLALRPGDRVIEAGSGWGALALHMARHYGVTVRAYNISTEQLEHSRARAAAEGLTDRVTFVGGDYRAIEGACDAFVSVGMLEHVGASQYRALGEVIERVLDPRHGRGLLHFIGRNRPAPFSPWISRYIFPGAYAPALSEVVPDVFERFDLSIVDVENLRLHYAATLSHWLSRFEMRVDEVRRMFDERFVRMWRLYLACARASFTSGDLQLFQVTFERANDGVVPATRRALYGQ
jgi:cyclopropane-fatty-acyl-phospholipid synthase